MENGNILHLGAHRRNTRAGISGLFWQMPVEWRHQRIRALGRALAVDQIAALARLPVEEVGRILRDGTS